MAKITKGITGGFSGKIGNIVGYTSKNKNIIQGQRKSEFNRSNQSLLNYASRFRKLREFYKILPSVLADNWTLTKNLDEYFNFLLKNNLKLIPPEGNFLNLENWTLTDTYLKSFKCEQPEYNSALKQVSGSVTSGLNPNPFTGPYNMFWVVFNQAGHIYRNQAVYNLPFPTSG